MSIINPTTKFIEVIEKDTDQVLKFFEMKMAGKNKFNLGSTGNNIFFYTGKNENNIFYLTRDIDTSLSIPIYPTAKFSIYPTEEKKTSIIIECSLSNNWIVMLTFIYSLIFIVLIFKLINSYSLWISFMTILKVFASVILINILIYGYHFSEVKNFQKLFKQIKEYLDAKVE
jgi:hypothetical protein